MDWSNERYVRVYTRDTTTWKLMDWRARTVLLHLFRKVDRAGVIEVGDDGLFGLAAVLELPMEVVEPGIEQLTRQRGQAESTVVNTGRAFVIPRFMEAQDASMTDTQRKRESRSRRRAEALSGSHGSRNVTDLGQTVTKRDLSAAVTNGHNKSRASPDSDSRSQNVTDSHENGQKVTNGHTRSQSVTPIRSRSRSSPDPIPIRTESARDLAADFSDPVDLSRRDPRFRYVPSDAGPARFMIFNGDEYLLHVEELADGTFSVIAE